LGGHATAAHRMRNLPSPAHGGGLKLRSSDSLFRGLLPVAQPLNRPADALGARCPAARRHPP
jgi:hypothetical protein